MTRPLPPDQPRKAKGTPRGSKQRPWTSREQRIVEWAEDHGIKAGALQGLLPGRPKQQIQNSFALLRKARRGQCQACGHNLTPEDKIAGHKLCTDCRASARQVRRDHIAEGRCAACGGPICPPGAPTDVDASLTLCGPCNRRHHDANIQSRARWDKTRTRKHQGGTSNRRRLFPYLGSYAGIDLLPKLTHPGGGAPWTTIYDLFGGSGLFGFLAKQAHPSATLVYNDIHPGLAAILEAVRSQPRRFEEISEPAASTLAKLFAPRGVPDHRFYQIARQQGAPLLDQVLNLDALDLLRDALTLPKALFILDPPWEALSGGGQPYEYPFDQARIPELLDLLAQAVDRGHEFIYFTRGSQTLLTALRASPLHLVPLGAHAYLYNGGAKGRSFVICSPGLAPQFEAGDRLTPWPLG